ncbi:hypothetical protein PG630_05455 [Riemerella anatipestifer]|nr:hypothetical protein [Riemerella anatipestifer]
MNNKITFLLILAVILQWSKAQVVLQALDAPSFSIPPSLGTFVNSENFIVSVYDTNYWPYIAPTTPATWNTNVNANGSSDPVVDIPGVITTTGTQFYVRFQAAAVGTLPAGSLMTEVPNWKTEDGQGRTLVMSWEDTSLSSGVNYVLVTVRSLLGDLKIKKLDVNAGNGVDSKGVELATFNFSDIQTGNLAKYTLRAIAGIPDRCWGKTTQECVGYGANVQEHNFHYVPIKGPDGRTWLNNNLGAGYARLDSPYFNPVHQAGTLDAVNTTSAVLLSNPTINQIRGDWRAYGSIFQWQRKADGHELINWTSSTSGTPKYNGLGSVSSSWTNAGTNRFIPDYTSEESWVIDSVNRDITNHRLWTANGSNNPCPVGYHVPTNDELRALVTVITGLANNMNHINNSNMWSERSLFLPASGFRGQKNPSLHAQSTELILWGSETPWEDGYGYAVAIWTNNERGFVGPLAGRANGTGVRCLQD